ncbi:mechanosensitive ion channel family protein, partial [Flavobacteriales bacterium]|nr:mechanosensitive ion channel family protein [Flavobacteriales bacterium]
GVEKFDNLLTRPIAFFIMLSILYFGFHAAEFDFEKLKSTLGEGLYNGLVVMVTKGFSLIFIYSIFRILLRIVDYVGLILLKRADETESKMDDQLIPFAIEIIKFIVYIFAVFIILGSVLNVNITALVTGLGIGGLALAMASKESLENLLGSFTIFLDKPFTVGDTVTAGSITGTVEKVGFRSTQLRTFDKSLVTVPNKMMVDAELDNLGMRPVRRVKFNIGLNYETTAEQIKKIVSDIQNMVDNHPKTNDEGKVKFQEFGSSSLDLLVIYFVDSPSWEDLIDVREDINYKIMEIVKKHNSDFAFPSTTVYLQKN